MKIETLKEIYEIVDMAMIEAEENEDSKKIKEIDNLLDEIENEIIQKKREELKK